MDEAKRPDWEAVRAAYEAGAVSVDSLCKTFNIARWQLYRQRRDEGWQPRYKKNRLPLGFAKSSRKANRKSTRRKIMINRFFEALERQMADVERKLEADAEIAETSATSRERDARTLSSLVRTLEKLFELDTGADPAIEARKEAAHRDIEGLRQALADRIARLGRSGKD